MSSAIAGMTALEHPFSGALDHLDAELRLLKLLLHRQALRLRASGRLVENAFRGLFIADEQVDAILDGKPAAPDSGHLADKIAYARREIGARLAASDAAHASLPLPRLCERLNLSAFERSVIVAAAAPDLDLDFALLYAYVQNDVNRKRPTADLLLRVFSESPAEHRAALSAAGALLKFGIVRASNPDDAPFLAREFSLDDRMTEFLLNRDSLDARLAAFSGVVRYGPRMSNVLLPPVLKTGLLNTARQLHRNGGVIVLRGAEGSGRRTVASALSEMRARPLVTIDLSRAAESALPLSEALLLLNREALLLGANVFFDRADLLTPAQFAVLESGIGEQRHLTFVASQAPPAECGLRTTAPLRTFSIPVPSAADRRKLWESAVENTLLPFYAEGLDELVNKFAITGGQIREACANAAAAARSADSDEALLTVEALATAVRAQTGHALAKLAPRFESNHRWADLVLPARAVEQLRAIFAAYRFRDRVYGDWGFGGGSPLGKGLNVLFYGASGTGKTMAAGVLANELSLDLFKIDLSAVMSKFIGETEKQLAEIFRQAQASHAILLFDEADALFGKRSESKDAHDRYANVETAYLLQRIEEYDGIAILTTNFRNNIDEAFARRMHHIVEFPLPDPASRLQIWKRLIPASAPLAADVDFAFLARQFELSGGHIRNAVTGAAFLAAQAGSEIGMAHLVISTAREMLKLGKLPSKADFRGFFELVHTA
jgi:hypothetical protein